METAFTLVLAKALATMLFVPLVAATLMLWAKLRA